MKGVFTNKDFQFIYRLTKCPELTLGIFTLPVLDDDDQPKAQPELVAHVISTRTSALRVTEDSMRIPPDWQTRQRSLPDEHDTEVLGHEDQGGTIALHSLAVKPEHQKKQVGTTLMKSYIQRIKEAAIADRIALLAHDHMIPFYEALGFENYGPSECTFGGGGWFDMVRLDHNFSLTCTNTYSSSRSTISRKMRPKSKTN